MVLGLRFGCSTPPDVTLARLLLAGGSSSRSPVKQPAYGPMASRPRSLCADVGSIAQSKFAWARRHPTGEDEELHAPASIDSLAGAVIHQLACDRPVALGLEMPLVIPVPSASNDLGRARPCDQGRTSWSQSTGASVMATGLVQLAWILDRVGSSVSATAVHLDWDRFCADRAGVFYGRHS
jgi:hypothetical protein